MTGEATNRTIAFASTIVVVAVTFSLLVLGRDLLIPIAVAIMIWYLLNALAKGFNSLPLKKFQIPLNSIEFKIAR